MAARLAQLVAGDLVGNAPSQTELGSTGPVAAVSARALRGRLWQPLWPADMAAAPPGASGGSCGSRAGASSFAASGSVKAAAPAEGGPRPKQPVLSPTEKLQPLLTWVGDPIIVSLTEPHNNIVSTDLGLWGRAYYCKFSTEPKEDLPETVHPVLRFAWPVKNVRATLTLVGETGKAPQNRMIWDAEFAKGGEVAKITSDMPPDAGVKLHMEKMCFPPDRPHRFELHVTAEDPRDELRDPGPPPRKPPPDLKKRPDRSFDETVQFEVKLLPEAGSVFGAQAPRRKGAKRHGVDRTWGPYIQIGSMTTLAPAAMALGAASMQLAVPQRPLWVRSQRELRSAAFL